MSIEYTTFANPIGIRLKSEMKKRGFTSTELARRADVLTSFLYDIISGKSSNPSTIKLARVADALGVNLNYLVTGDANNFSIGTTTSQKDNFVTIPRIIVKNGNIITNDGDDEPYYFRSEWIKNYLGTNIADLRLLTISGDAMQPTLLHNDIVLIDTSKKHPTPPAIFILFDGVGLAAKRCELLSDNTNPQVRVISDNSSYSTYDKSLADVLIVGRVIWFSRGI